MQDFPWLTTYTPNLIFDEESKTKQAQQLLSWFKEDIDFHLNFFLQERRKEIAEISKEAVDLVNEIERFVLAGGKRSRPAFIYSGYVAAGGKAHDAILFASMCVEFLHTFALIHDDIFDRSDTRRGEPTSHRAFESLYAAKKLKGDGTQFSLSAAILAGDLASTFAEEVLNRAPFPQERLRRARFFFDQMKAQVIAGEYLDVLGGYKIRLSEEEVLNILEYKTAKYTVERPLQIGATLAGAEIGILETFTAYGIPLGQAFQLQDDILGTFGNVEDLGKPVDSDIREGKKTVLVAKAYEWANNKQRKILDEVLGSRRARRSDIKMVQKIVYQVGAYDYAARLSQKLIEQAKYALESAKLTKEGKNYLLAAADFLLNRV